MKAQKTGFIASYIDIELKTKYQKLLVLQKIAAYAKTTKHCEIANATYRWFVLRSLARRYTDDDSSVFNAVIYKVMLCIFFNACTGFFVHKEISHTGIDLGVRANINGK